MRLKGFFTNIAKTNKAFDFIQFLALCKNNINKFHPLKTKSRSVLRKPSYLLIFISLETFLPKTLIHGTNINTVKANEHINPLSLSCSAAHFQKIHSPCTGMMFSTTVNDCFFQKNLTQCSNLGEIYALNYWPIDFTFVLILCTYALTSRENWDLSKSGAVT